MTCSHKSSVVSDTTYPFCKKSQYFLTLLVIDDDGLCSLELYKARVAEIYRLKIKTKQVYS